jgi:hypothetical protein
MTTILEPNDDGKRELLAEMRAGVASGVEGFRAAGCCVVRLVDDFGMSLREISEVCLQGGMMAGLCSVRTLGIFEKIGRGMLLPSLALEAFPAANYLQKMPISEQERLVESQVELVTIHDGVVDVLQVAVRDLTKRQCEQVFDGGTVRSVGAQRAWLEDEATTAALEKKAVAGAVNYKLKGGKLIVLRECEFTPKELARILTDLQ